ncbi:hypothetical protein HORM4_610093 [Vibrio harveyi]|nr:hypothetical protein HORM4_610093 [Vibrio harveyi]
MKKIHPPPANHIDIRDMFNIFRATSDILTIENCIDNKEKDKNGLVQQN